MTTAGLPRTLHRDSAVWLRREAAVGTDQTLSTRVKSSTLERAWVWNVVQETGYILGLVHASPLRKAPAEL